MVTGIEGIGEAVTGAMLARAVEPEAGSAADEHGTNCLNCGAPLQGEFCHRCGQSGHVHRTVGAFWHDIAHSVFHFDGKMWRTLPLLAWHPGQLTRRYIEGERAKFVSPMAIFLFSVFLMFAIVHSLGGPFAKTNFKLARSSAEVQQEFDRERAQGLKKLAKLQAKRAQLAAAGKDTADVDGEIRDSESELADQVKEAKRTLAEMAAAMKARDLARGKQASGNPIAKQPQRQETTVAGGTADTGGAREARQLPGTSGDEARLDIHTMIPAVDRGLKKASENPSLLAYKLQSNAYKFSWALIPISVPFVWLLFLHRRRYRKYKAYDHIVFVTYSIAFMSIGLTALTLLKPLGSPQWIAALAIALVPPIHMYRQLRGAYQLSGFSALWRTAFLLIFAFVAAGLFLTLLLALGAFD